MSPTPTAFFVMAVFCRRVVEIISTTNLQATRFSMKTPDSNTPICAVDVQALVHRSRHTCFGIYPCFGLSLLCACHSYDDVDGGEAQPDSADDNFGDFEL